MCTRCYLVSYNQECSSSLAYVNRKIHLNDIPPFDYPALRFEYILSDESFTQRQCNDMCDVHHVHTIPCYNERAQEKRKKEQEKTHLISPRKSNIIYEKYRICLKRFASYVESDD